MEYFKDDIYQKLSSVFLISLNQYVYQLLQFITNISENMLMLYKINYNNTYLNS